jgi:hypothetical protein
VTSSVAICQATSARKRRPLARVLEDDAVGEGVAAGDAVRESRGESGVGGRVWVGVECGGGGVCGGGAGGLREGGGGRKREGQQKVQEKGQGPAVSPRADEKSQQDAFSIQCRGSRFRKMKRLTIPRDPGLVSGGVFCYERNRGG